MSACLRAVRVAAAFSIVLAGCGGNDVTSPRAGLQLLASISDARIEGAETAIFTYTVRNASPAAVSLEYPGASRSRTWRTPQVSSCTR